MSFETGGTFNPGIPNESWIWCYWLNPVYARTARGLGTTTRTLAGMSRAEQMHYVEKYLSNKGISGKGLSDVHGCLVPCCGR